MFKKKWVVVETNEYFVPHTQIVKQEFGPFRTRAEAERVALWHANRALRNQWMLEFKIKNIRDNYYVG